MALGWPICCDFANALKCADDGRRLQVYFNPKEVTYERLLDLFFDRADPTTKNRYA